jgi:hypothetical protein
MTRRSAFYIFAGSVLSTAALLAQQKASSGGTPPCSFSELFNRTGWKIPGLEGATARVTGAQLKAEGVPPGVFADLLEPKVRAASVTLAYCVVTSAGRIEIREQPVDVLKLLRFSMNGRVFAYEAMAGFTGLSGENRVALGTSVTLFYFDEDGSGRFAVQRGAAPPGAQIKLWIPEWAKSPAR